MTNYVIEKTEKSVNDVMINVINDKTRTLNSGVEAAGTGIEEFEYDSSLHMDIVENEIPLQKIITTLEKTIDYIDSLIDCIKSAESSK